MRERYNFETKDRELLKSAVTLLKKVAAAPCLKAAELVSVAKLLHVFSRLPLVTPGVQVTVSVGSPRREFGEVETWYLNYARIEGGWRV